MCTAAAPPRQLALPVTSTTITPDQPSDDSRMLMDDLDIKEVTTKIYCIEPRNLIKFLAGFIIFLPLSLSLSPPSLSPPPLSLYLPLSHLSLFVSFSSSLSYSRFW